MGDYLSYLHLLLGEYIFGGFTEVSWISKIIVVFSGILLKSGTRNREPGTGNGEWGTGDGSLRTSVLR